MRPENISDFTLFADKNAVCHDKVEIWYGTHQDDLETFKMVEKLRDRCKIKLYCVALEKMPDGLPHLSKFWNDLYDLSNFNILGFFGDDVKIRTHGWDKIVLEEFQKDKNILVYGNDVHCQRGAAATLFFTHRECHERFGFYMYPAFRRCQMDQFWDMVYNKANRRIYKKNLILEHCHPGNGKFKHKVDDTYRILSKMFHRETKFTECLADLEKCVQILNRMKRESKAS